MLRTLPNKNQVTPEEKHLLCKAYRNVNELMIVIGDAMRTGTGFAIVGFDLASEGSDRSVIQHVSRYDGTTTWGEES